MWHLIYSDEASRALKKLDRQASKKIVRYLNEHVLTLEDPRSVGKALKGSKWGDYWRYRCGDYRIIVDIQDDEVVVLVLRIGHRKDVY